MAHEHEFLEAVKRGDTPIVADLLRGQPNLARFAGEHDKTGLHWAAETDQAVVARILLDAGADIEAVTSWGATPLDWAVVMGSVRVADLLLSRGALGFTLIAAAALGKLEAVKATIESGADLYAQRRRGAPGSPDDEWPPDSAHMQGDVLSDALYSAARNGHASVVAYLLDAGAQIDAKGFFGATGLHWAAINGHRHAVDLLLARGASVTIRDARFNATPEDWAKEGGHMEIAAALQARRVNGLTHIESAPLAATMGLSRTRGPQQGAALMNGSTKHVALDVHQATTLVSVREESGRVIARTILPTEEPAIVEFFGGMRGAIQVAFEEGTQAQWLHDLLLPLVDRVVVCDRRGEARQGNKGDQVDADQLSEGLRRGGLRSVYHGSAHRATLKELTRTYQNLVEDATRVMLRLKALFRARGIKTPGKRVYHPRHRAQWLAQLPQRGARFRAETLYAELDVLRTLRPKVKAAMLAEARRDPAWPVLRTIPFMGPVRVALLLATMQTPWRFRTKRNLWAYAGLAVVTRSSADYTLVAGQPVRRRRAPLTRGLNRNHSRVLKDVFKGAATAATGRPGPLQDFYHDVLARGVREELARVTLARKLAAITLRLWKKGERFDPHKLTMQAR